jgi:cytochrome c
MRRLSLGDRCRTCQSRPHLEGILGRPVASVQGYRYSTAIQSMSFIWTKPRFEKLLRQLQRVAPGLCVPFTGFAARRDRENLIAFLERPDS